MGQGSPRLSGTPSKAAPPASPAGKDKDNENETPKDAPQSKPPSGSNLPSKEYEPPEHKFKLRWWEFSSKRGPVYGLARRKGERNPKNYGLEFDSKYLGHPALAGSHELPPVNDKCEYEKWKKKVFGVM